MSSYKPPRFNTSIFLYSSTPSSSSTVVVPSNTSITDERMTEISLFTNYSYIWAAYPWMNAPNKKPKSLYNLWNDLLYGQDYLEETSPGVFSWTESLEYVINGTVSPYKITGPGIDFKATTVRPRGLTAVGDLTLTRPYKPFVLSFSGTPTDGCIIFTVSNFKMELMADYSVKFYLDNIEVARSVPLGTLRAVNILGFSEGAVTGNSIIQDTTGVSSFSRPQIASDIVITPVSSTALPSIIKTGSCTWTIKPGITLNGLNMYDLPMTSLNLIYETYMAYDISMVRTEPPTYIPT